MLMWWIALALAWAGPRNPEIVPYAGLEYRPFSRADLVWTDDNRTSGTSVGEYDGTVNPGLGAYVGMWIGRHAGLQMGIGVARLQNTVYVDESYQQHHWGVVRPSIDLRVCLTERRFRFPVPFTLLGAFVDIPSARDVSDGYSEDEQAAANETAQIERLMLWGVGMRTGLGVGYRLLPGLLVGAQFTVGWTQSFLVGQDSSSISSWVATEAAVLLEFEWPPRGPSEPPSAER